MAKTKKKVMGYCKLQGLKGVTEEIVDAAYFKTVSEGLKLIRNGQFATTADSNGAINIYTDDEGVYRGYRMKFWGTQDFIVTMKRFELQTWLSENLPKIKDM